jgi:hypothetical protein
MSAVSLQSKIINDIIEPAFQPEQIKQIAWKTGHDIEACLIDMDFADLLEKVTDRFVKEIEQFIKTQDALTIDSQAPSMKVREIFAPEIEGRLRRVCNINPRKHGGYNTPLPSWTWQDLISFFTSKSTS